LNALAKLNDWEADYQQLGRGAFEGRYKLFQSETLSVTNQTCNQEMAVTGVCPADEIPLFVVTNKGERGRFNGKRLLDNEAFVMRAGKEGVYRTPRHLRMINLQIPEPRLRAATRSMADSDLDELIPDTRRIVFPTGSINRLTQLADSMMGISSDLADTDARRLWELEAEEYLVTTLVSGLTAAGGTRSETGRKNHLDYVAHARSYIDAHIGSPLGLETLAREVGVTLRTLETAFRRVYGTTPLRYVKARRLRAARRRLLETSSFEASVTEVALDCGFSHLSYFALDYKKLFGECPSETLRGRGARL
jgi:AraC family ethanolamine operon transcriptional activator